jgi:Tol biopolymer transport system component
MNDKINTRYHEGLVSFSPDGETMYFSRESYFEKDFEKDSISKVRYSQLYLFKATKLGSDWDTVESLSINSENYSVKNPSVSADGKTMYFASDMPGGYGNFDIYKAPIKEDGTLGEPQNLGQKVNTEGQEMFPYISSNGTLYFSSNGHLGLGGMDVFYTKEIDGKMAPIRNVGIPINSNGDDFAFTIDEEAEEGFVSSNRDGGKGSDDVYAFKKLQPLCDVLRTSNCVR